MSIRLIRYSDKKALCRIFQEDTGLNQIITQKEFLQLLDHPNYIIYVAEYGSDIVGYIIYTYTKKYYQLIDLFVLKDYRRRKYGTRLLNKIIERLLPTGRNRIVYYADESNILAQLFLKSHQFRGFCISQDYIVFKYCLAFSYKEKNNGS